METSWTTQLIGRTVEGIERWEALPCVVKLSGGYRIQIEGLWRLLSGGSLILTSEDDGQRFGHKAPIDAITVLSSTLVSAALRVVEVAPGTADLLLGFDRHVLQAISNSSGYEAWQVEGPRGMLAVGQGGGNVAVLD